jgi:hypothetical protein
MPRIKGMYEHYIREALHHEWDAEDIEKIVAGFKRECQEDNKKNAAPNAPKDPVEWLVGIFEAH